MGPMGAFASKSILDIFIKKAKDPKNPPFKGTTKCPNREDADFLLEQLWLGGEKDAKHRASIALNIQCGGRVSEVS